MKRAEVFAQLESLLKSEAFSVERQLSPDTRFTDIEGWDSFKHLRFLLEVEDKFDFELSPEDGEMIEALGELAEVVQNLDN
jgi:acyl carrier protein